MTYILVLTLAMSSAGPGMVTIPDYKSEAECENAGKKFLKDTYQYMWRGGYSCLPSSHPTMDETFDMIGRQLQELSKRLP